MATKIFTFIPAFGQTLTAATFLTSHAVMMTLAQKGIAGGISTLSFPDIAELRSMAVTVWYDTMPDTTHILFIDADMAFDPQLILDMLLFDEPLVGAIYPQRRLPISWAGSGTGETQSERRGDFMRVEGVGMGITLIRRDCIATMLEKMPEIVDTRIELHPAKDMVQKAGANRLIRAFEKLDIPERGVVSEDLSFCLRWNRCGGQVWAAIGHHISHVGPFDFKARYLDMIEAAQRKQAEDLQAAANLMQANLTAEAPRVQVVPAMQEVLTPADAVMVEMPNRAVPRFEVSAGYVGGAEAQAAVNEVVKRGRGRPRKVPVALPPLDANGPMPVKRGRGRPRKNPQVAA